GRDQEEAARPLARAGALEVLGDEQLRDVGTGAIPRGAHAPLHVTLRDHREADARLVGVVVERAGVLPLAGEAEGRGGRRVEDLVLRRRPCIRQLDAELVEEREVDTTFRLRRRLGLQLGVTSLAERAAGRAAGVGLVLRRERRGVARRAAREAEPDVREVL